LRRSIPAFHHSNTTGIHKQIVDLPVVLWLTLRMTIVLTLLLYCTAAILCYAWIAFPLLLLITTRSTCHAPRLTPLTPHLVILLAAFNEADVIAARIANLASIDYPHDRLRVLIGTDGCTDNTSARAREAAAATAWIEVIEFDQNRGKVAVLRDLVERASRHEPLATGTLLVFTDANTHFRTDALRMLARHFADPGVGGVCGRLLFTGSGSHAEQSYWNLENTLKARESTLDSCLGANGAIYALRRECFWANIPANTIVDDFVIGMKVREAGYRMLYDPDAVAEEEVPAVQDEWRRRIRIGSGDYQAAWLCRRCLHPRFGPFAWCFWSHKILRWFTPHLSLAVIASAAWLACRQPAADRPAALLARAVCLGATAILAAAIMGRLSRRLACSGAVWTLCRGLDHFVTMQAALLLGFARACRGNLSGAWARTPREPS